MNTANLKETINCQTEHYSFILEIDKKYDKNGNPLSYHLLVGDDKNPCLSIYFYSKNAEDIFGQNLVKVANIINIKNLDQRTLKTGTCDPLCGSLL